MKNSTGVKVIDGLRFEFTQLSSRKALPIYTFLLSLVGKTAAKSSEGIKNFDELNGLKDFLNAANVDISKILDALAEALQDIDRNPKLESHVDTLLDSVINNGQALNLDSIVFNGKMLLLTRVVIEAVKYNFSDFFGESGELGKVLRKTASSQDSVSEKQT